MKDNQYRAALAVIRDNKNASIVSDFFGDNAQDDYFEDDTIPSLCLSDVDTRIDILDYYHFWFPLVEKDLKQIN